MTLYSSTYNQKHIRDVYRALEDGIFRDATFGRDVTVTRNLTVTGTITFGDAAVDNFLIKGRVSSMTAAGSDITIDATTYQYGEGVDLRWAVSDWADTYTLTQFQGLYIRTENQEDGASKTLRAAEFTARDNDVGIGVLETLHCNSYIKGATAGKTIGSTYGITGQVEFADSAGTRTITTEAVAVRGIMLATTGITGLTKMHGLQLVFGDTDGGSPVMGSGIVIQDSTGHSGTCTLTTGINIPIACTTGITLSGATTTAISITGDATTGISITSGMSATNVISIGATASTAGINISGDCTTGITIAAQTTAGVTVSGATAKGIIVSGACTTAAINISGDQAIGILYDVDAAATDGLKLAIDDAITVTTGINLEGTGTGAATTGISVACDGTTAISVTSAFSGTTMLSLAGTGTDGINISGICVDAIEISAAATTTGLNISADCVTGITIGAQTTAGITIGATATGVTLGNCTTGIDLSSATVSGDDINLSASGVLNAATSIALEIGGSAQFTLTASTVTFSDAIDIAFNTTTGTKIGTATGQKIGFYNATPVVQASAMTAPLTDLTHTAPSTPDYAIQDLTSSTPYGFVSADEGNTVLKVIQANKVHIAEIEAILNGLGLCAT